MTQQAWRLALGGLAALAAGMGVGRFVYTPILPVMSEALGLSVSDAGLIASANFIGYLAGALAAALPVFKGSRRPVLMGALLFNALGLAAMGLTESFAAHLVLRFAAGIANAFILIFASALVLDRLAAMGRERLAPVHFAGVGTGVAVSASAVAAILALGGDWRSLWFASGAMGLAGLALVALLIERGEPPAIAQPTRTGAGPSFAMRAIIIAYGLFGLGYVVTATFIVAIVRAEPAISAMEPYVWLLFGLSAAPSVAIWMRLGARLGTIEAYALACFVEAVGVACSMLWVSQLGIAVAVVFLGGTVMGITALGMIAVRRMSLGDPRLNLALMTASFGAGQAAGPAIAGFLADRLGGFLVPTLAASLALVVAAGLSLLAASSERKIAARAVPPMAE